jgi:hypothetical protein
MIPHQLKRRKSDMARVVDCGYNKDVKLIIEKMLDKFSKVFEGFDLDKVGIIETKGKKVTQKTPIKVKPIGYPAYMFTSDKIYTMEVNQAHWFQLDDKRKRLSVFRAMLAIPTGGFEEDSKFYGKLKKPDYQVYKEEFAVTEGVLDWMEDDRARDPEDIDTESDDVTRSPVTVDDIQSGFEASA